MQKGGPARSRQMRRRPSDAVLAVALAWLAASAAPAVFAQDTTDQDPTDQDTTDPESTAPTAPEGMVSLTGFAAPESVLIDRARGVVYVANINGGPGEADDNGFISRINLDDMSVESHWIDGATDSVRLDAPKGMALTPDGFLLVSDIDRLRAFLIETGEPSAVLEVADAVFLNDLWFEDGTLYVSDSGASDTSGRLLAVDADGGMETVAEGADLVRPNGVAVDGSGRLLVATLDAARILAIAEDGAPTTVADLPAGRLDGLVPLADGSLLVSSWEAGAVFRVAADGGITTVVDGLASPADIDAEIGAATDAGGAAGLLAIPILTENRVILMPLPE